MDNKRENVSLWLHNKLGTSNDSWISSSISSQLNKDVLKQIKDCFPDLQTQVKIKFLLAFFHIPRRLVEEWKTELEEIIEVATSDTELWVSMTAETMKTFPLTGSLNTEISDYEETRPIFTDMVNDLKKLVNKHHDIGMLPLECQYLNKSALISVVGQQPGPTKHFTLKKKPKSATLRAELLQKCSDAQSTLKKSSAPTVPLRSRGMPRKMADTTPMRGIPSRVPTSGFRSPPPSITPKSLNRTPAGRKEGGVKLLDIADQPLGYAQAKKRKRQQELEEQQRKALEAQTQQQQQQNNGAATAVSTPSTTTPDYAAGLTASSVYSQPATPMPSSSAANQTTIKEIQSSTPITSTSILTPNNHIVVQSNVPVVTTLAPPQPIVQQPQQQQQINSPTQQTVAVVSSPPTKTTTLPSNIQIVRSVSYNPPGTQQIHTPTTTIGPPPPSVEIVRKTVPTSSIQQSYTKILGNSNIILTQKPMQQPTISVQQSPAQTQPITSYTIVKQPVGQTQMRVVAVSSAPTSNITLPTLTTTLPRTTQIIQQQQQQGQTPTKIVQIKTAPTMPTMMVASSQPNTISSIPPLISTHQQQPQLVNIQNMHQYANQQRKTVTITTQNQPTSNIILQQQQQPQQTQIQQTIQQNPQTIITGGAGNQTKYAQVVMSPNVKGKTIILTNPNLLSGQKNVILRSGNTVYQLGNVQGLQNLNVGGTTLMTTTGPPGLIKTDSSGQTQGTTQQMPALVPTNQQMPSLTPVVYANQQQKSIPTLITNLQTQQGNHMQHQTQTQGQTIIRPVLSTGGQLPQGLTLIQRPGQQPQLVQTIQQTQTQPTQIGRTIITAQPQQKTTIQQQPQILSYKKIPQQTTIQLQQVPQQQQQQQQQTIQQQQQAAQVRKQGKGLSLSSKHVTEAHDMFKRANRVTRLDKALILGFMAGYRDNPRPNPENVVEIKLNESEENVKQGDDIIPMIVETLIHLDYNTGEWKTFNRCAPPKSGQEQQVPNAQSVSAS